MVVDRVYSSKVTFLLQIVRNNIRGELTVAHTKEQFSLKDNSFIAAVASSLQISSSKVTTTS